MAWPQQYLAVMAAVINRHGHAVQYVLDDTGTGAPPFAYTVGLHAHHGRGYELALSGLPPEVSVSLLNDLAAALAGRHPVEGMEIHGLLQDGLTLRLRRVTRRGDFTVIRAIYGATPTAWQALWPDRDGRYPSEPGCTLPDTAQALL